MQNPIGKESTDFDVKYDQVTGRVKEIVYESIESSMTFDDDFEEPDEPQTEETPTDNEQ